MQSSSGPPTLSDQYRQLVDASDTEKRRLRATIDMRSRLAAEILARDAALLDPLTLADQLERLRLVSHPATPEGRAEAETTRVRLAVLEQERQRREAAESAPPRTEVTSALVRLTGDIARDPEGPASQTLSAIVARAHEAFTSGLSPADAVADALDVAAHAGEDGEPTDGWGWSAILLEILTSPHAGLAGVRIRLNPVNEAEAMRAKRLFWGHARQDPRYEGIDWPCDLTANDVARIMRTTAAAHAEWVSRGLPESDLMAYRAPCRAEEHGRPEPGPWVTDSATAQQEAEAAGGVTIPLVLPLHPQHVARASRHVWVDGVAIEPEDGVGVSLFSVPGDSRVRWGGPAFPFGIICAVVAKPDQVLSIGRHDDTRHEQLLDTVSREIGEKAGTDEEYAELLRNALRDRGFLAVARYDHINEETPHPDEVVLLDTSPKRLRVVRGAVPSFLSPLPPFRVPGNKTLVSMPSAESVPEAMPPSTTRTNEN